MFRYRAAAAQPTPAASFGPLAQVDAGALDIGYVELGPAGGPAVILLHGWPYDIHSFAEVAPLLAAAGYRVIVPYLRGYGTTRFLADDAVRNGQQAALAVDVDRADGRARDRAGAIIAGFDWGARTADIVAALWPERCQGAGLGQRLPDRQPGGQPDAACRRRPNCLVVPVLLRHRARPRRLRRSTGATSPG